MAPPLTSCATRTSATRTRSRASSRRSTSVPSQTERIRLSSAKLTTPSALINLVHPYARLFWAPRAVSASTAACEQRCRRCVGSARFVSGGRATKDLQEATCAALSASVVAVQVKSGPATATGIAARINQARRRSCLHPASRLSARPRCGIAQARSQTCS